MPRLSFHFTNWTGARHLFSNTTLLTKFLARVLAAFHHHLDRVDSYKYANQEFGNAIPHEFASKNFLIVTVDRNIPRGVEGKHRPGHADATYHRYNFRTNYS